MPLYSLPRPNGFRALPSGLLALDSRSPYLLQGDTPPAQPGEQQPFPTTAAALISALGATGVIAPADVKGIYLMNTASPLVDALGLGPNLVAGGGPLTSRECIGLPDTSFANKVGVEVTGAGQYFRAAAGAEAFADANASVVSVLVVARLNSNATNLGIVSKYGADGKGWALYWNAGNFVIIAIGGGAVASSVPFATPDGSWHCFGVPVDDTVQKCQLFSDIADGALSAAYPGSASTNGLFNIGAQYGSGVAGQVAYVAVLGKAITSAMRAAFWRAYNLNAFNTPCGYTRAGPLVVPISASRVACYGANQPAVGYAPNASAGDNALRSSVVCEDGITFEAIGSNNLAAVAAGAGVAVTFATDGPSGMRDGMRATMAGAWAPGATFGYLTAAGVAIVGASNVPWRYDSNYKRATVGTTAQLGFDFRGDAGGGETFTTLTDAATPVDWVRGGGTCTPVRAGQTIFYPIFGATNNLDDCDFGEPAVIKNRATAPLAWRRVGTAAAAVTGTPSLSVTNLLNARYSPARGRLRLRVSDFQGTNGAVFLGFGAAAAAGSLVLDYSGGALRLRLWDDVAALVGTATCGAVTTAEHIYVIEWDAAIGKAGVWEGATVLGSFAGIWTPEPNAITPLYVGCDSAGANAARCNVVVLEGWDR